MCDPILMPAMVSEAEFMKWRNRVKDAFELCRETLENTEGPLAERLLVMHVVGERNDRTFLLGNPAYARSAAIEDVDYMVSRGCFMVINGMGAETHRALKIAKLEEAQWQGSSEFHALYRGKLRSYCVKEIRGLLPLGGARIDDERFDEGTLAVGPDESLQVYERVISELSRFGENLLRRRRMAEAITTKGIIDVLEKAKKIEEAARKPKKAKQDGDAEQDKDAKASQESDHSAFWRAVAAELNIEDDALAKRKQRFFEQICALRYKVSEWFFQRAIRMLIDDAVQDVRTCETILSVWGAPCRAAIEAVRDFLLWHMADQHPKFNGRTLNEIRNQGAVALATFGGQFGAYQWPPSGAGFASFCAGHQLLAAGPETELNRLYSELLASKMKRRPTAMISIVKSLQGGH